MDGVATGINLLQAILRSVQNELKPIAVAILDLQKAFDSVAHSAIFDVIDNLDIPDGLKSYMKYIYHDSKTYLTFKSDRSNLFHPVKGVSQGDTLSPTLFLLIFNYILDLLPAYTGFNFDGTIINQLS